MDARHKWMFGKVAEAIGVDVQVVQDAVAKLNKLTLLNDFFKESGPKRVLFFHQPPQRIDEYGEVVEQRDVAPRLIVTDGSDDGLTGRCLYFLRVGPKGVTAQRIEEDVVFGVIDSNVLMQLQEQLKFVLLPALENQESWGEISRDTAQTEFLDGVEKFVDTLNDALSSMKDNVQLQKPDRRFTVDSTPAGFTRAAANPDLVESYEATVQSWVKQVEHILAESELIRKESDDVGPYTELEYWKARMAKFNSITDQLKSKDFKLVLNVLKASKSKLLKKWKELDNRITDAANEAKDNVRYLYTLEKNCEPLYKADPPAVMEALPSLLQAIKLMHSIARYYNTSERMTTLFVKITNQMIINCKRYLGRGGSLWEQDRASILKKLRTCMQLNQRYQEEYQAVKHEAHGRPFNFSEVTIFGKFDLFSKRLERIAELFECIDQFASLTTATMEGLDAMVKRFNEILGELKKKPYDLTDHRKQDFDADYQIFQRGIAQLEQELIEFINHSFSAAHSTERAISVLRQFKGILARETLKIVLNNKVWELYLRYGQDLDAIKAQYETQKDMPPISRNTPPVAGNIAWARQLLRKIEYPMEFFREHEAILQRRDAKPTIRQFNKLARALVQFEVIWHEGWCDAVQEAKAGLQATLLVRHPTSGRLFVNFDADIIRLLRETKALQRLDLDVPPAALTVVLQEDKLKQCSDGLRFMLRRYHALIDSIPDEYRAIIAPHVDELNDKIEPGLTTYTWTSLNIDKYIKDVHDAVARLEDFVAKANDTLAYRINANLEQIRRTPLLDLPQFANLQSIEEFIDHQDEYLNQQVPLIERKNQEIETAVHDMIALLTTGYSASQLDQLEEVITQFRSRSNKSLFDALLACIKGSLNLLKRRFASHALNVVFVESPVFKIDIELEIPNVVLRPSLEQVQKCVNYVAVQVLQATQSVFCWGQDRSGDDELKNFFHEIAANKEIVKAVLQLTGVFTGLIRSCNNFLAIFEEYTYLWKNSKTDEFAKFSATTPSLDDYEHEIDRFQRTIDRIEALVPYRVIGSLSLDSTAIKETLKKEAFDWKQMYGSKLQAATKTKMKELVEFVDDTTNALTRKTSGLDLEDVNQIMQVLERLRVMEAEIFMKLAPIDDTFNMLQKYNVHVRPEELEEMESLRHKWDALKGIAASTMDRLREIAPAMRESLVHSIDDFKKDVFKFKLEYDDRGPMVKGLPPRVASERLNTFKSLYEDRERKFRVLGIGEELFGLETTEYPDLVKMGKELKLLERLYGLYNDVINTIASYDDIAWVDMDIDKMTNEVNDFQARMRKMPPSLTSWDAFNELKSVIGDFSTTLPLLQALSSPTVEERHWQQISDWVGSPLDPTVEGFKVKNLLDAHLERFKDDVEELALASIKEADIRVKFGKISDEWSDARLTFTTFKKRGELQLAAAETGEMMTNLEDAQVNIGSLLGNRYNKPFRNDLQKWMAMLTTVQERLQLWLQVQNLWAYLEAVFSGGDIAAQMPQEAKRFQNIDKTWERIMHAAHDNNVVINFCYKEEILKNLLSPLQESLEICQKSLASYLEAKRGIFPRFFFVSDAQLLQILGQGSNPHTIQDHLTSIFDAIKTIEFDKVQRNKILGMASPQGETVAFTAPVMAEGHIEDWLNKLLDEMMRTIKDICRAMSQNAMAQLDTAEMEQLEGVIAQYPAQVSLLATQMWWTLAAEEALAGARTDKTAMPNGRKKFEAVLRHMVDITTKNLTKLERTRIETLITIHIHQVDIFNDLVKRRIRAANDFEWLKQTRFYWRADQDECFVQVTNCDFPYCYEYLGVAERLVITPLTDRIYISCAQAMNMFYGGAPAGPAGTGKTETTKDMGRTCGRYFITINCSDQMDYKAMGRLFKGISQSGCWCGFDEINRVDIAVLSVVAAQIQCMLGALKGNKREYIFTDGQKIVLQPTAACFITMNPGYAGRTELPENMKALFRTIAVVVPDRQIIMRVKLAAAGFQENIVLAKKFFVLYRLCEEQLSKQTHYDFGLRNILSVLRTCGSQKRSNPTQKEVMVLKRVLRDMNLSKLVDEDEPLFLSLIQDLFPNVKVDKESYPELEKAINESVLAEGLIDHPDWRLKVIQFYEQYRVRHGLCIMGPSGGGKTSLIRTLAKALSKTEQPIKEMRMNPKAITAEQMFGRLDPHTSDWTDGIFSALWRVGCATKAGKVTWIELDGPVDAVWIENLNTVLDDTRTLTLANGDRILMPPNLKLVFEVGNLDNASPATVSRLGMVFMGKTALGYVPVIDAWLQTRKANGEADQLRNMFNKHCKTLVEFVTQDCDLKMTNTEVNFVVNCLKLLDGLLPTTKEPGQPLQPQHLERLFTFASIWSFGGVLERDDRQKMHNFMAKLKFDLPQIDSSSQDSVFEYMVNQKGQWEHWTAHVPQYQYPRDNTPLFSSVLVPTVDNVRSLFLIDVIMKQSKPVLLIGESGTAKTVTIHQFIGQQNEEEFKKKVVSFSSATSPAIFQRNIESSVEKRIGTTYGPSGNKKMIVFIDDINMPEINSWGDQITNEIVRELIDDGGFYTLEAKRSGTFFTIADLLFVAAMNQPGGGRNDIPSRLKRQFTIYNVTLPSPLSIDKIYGAFATGHFCAQRGFSTDVQEVAKHLPTLTRRLWDATKRKMLPTPAKFHYIFNLRDLSRIFQGMLNSRSDIITSGPLLVQLWRHEASRVLPDKFTTEEDVKWFEDKTRELLIDEFDEEFAERCRDERYFVDFLRDAEEQPETDDADADFEPVVPKIYEPIESLPSLRERVEMFMQQYNENVKGSSLDLVLFDFALKHLMRISRIIRTSGGHALLVGVGGSGKQSLTRLAAYIAGYDTSQITITRTYNVGNLLDDLKLMFHDAVCKKPRVFLFTDNEVKQEGFLEYINMILSTGEIPGLFPKEELDAMLDELRKPAKAERPGFVDTPENLYSYFLDKSRDNLHVVLCFSPVGEKFRTRARKFPGLVNGCTMDWFPPWPAEALYSVADKFLHDFDIVGTPQVRDALVQHMCFVHSDIGAVTSDYFSRYRRYVYVTPKSYLSFINSFKVVYERNRLQIKEMADRIKTGLSKLLDATDDVAKMKVQLIAEEKELAVAQKQCSEFLVEITQQTTIAQAKKEEVQVVADECQATADAIEADKIAAENDLAAAAPLIEQAENALKSIKPADIATLKKLAKPPPLVKRIMDGVILLRQLSIDKVQVDPELSVEFQIMTPTWSGATAMMSDMRFLQYLYDFPKEQITDETCDLLEPYLNMVDFNSEAARKSSGNVAGLCTWIRAMYDYHWIYKTVEPKKQRLREAESQLRAARRDLAAAMAELAAKQAELDVMQAKYDEAMRQKTSLQEKADLTKRRLESAEALINGLAGERERWTKQSQEFDEQTRRLVGDCVLAAAFLSYAGPFNQDFRARLISEHWTRDLNNKKVPLTKGIDLVKFLTTESRIDQWNLEGLPRDDLSIQNGIIVTSAKRFPLLIDPQSQGKAWIRNREMKNNLKITNLNHRMFRQHVEDALENGTPLLLEDVGVEIDPVLDPVFDHTYIKGRRRKMIRLGDKEVMWEDGFMMYLTTKLPNPHYTPETSAKSSIIDFTVTMRGLEDQLLARVILQEKADLEESRQKLLKEIADCKALAEECEEKLLYKLSSVEGNLVDDPSVITVLSQTKAVAQDVKEKLISAKDTEQKITVAREEFRPAAHRGSVMYFVITELSMVNPMYQTSLGQFLQLFDQGIRTADRDPIVSKRVKNIIENATFLIYKYIQRGLYEKHKPMYQLMMTLKIDLHLGKIAHPDFAQLLKGGGALDINSVRKKPYEWIPDNSWLNLNALAALPTFASLVDQVVNGEAVWKAWYDKEDPENHEIPDGYDKLNKFQRLLLVRSWREDRTLVAAKQYVIDSIGQKYVEGIPLSFDDLYEESDLRTPMIGLLSMGSDPTSSIEALAKKMKIDLKMVSMGQGQAEIARQYVAECKTAGGWVLLQNCHLGLDYLGELEEVMTTLDDTVEPSFRLWITTEPIDRFPINMLQISTKYTNEPPQGMKAGLRRSYAWITQDMLEKVDSRFWTKLLYGTCFLHSTLIERKRFGPLGWCIGYEFNHTDLVASVQFLENYMYSMDPHQKIDWGTVRYMICEVQYGGRITDDYDKRLLVTYGSHWFDDSLFAPGYQFYDGYPLPEGKNINDFRGSIDTLPLNDTPQIFGLHPNAELTFSATFAREVLGTIMDVQPKEGGGSGGETREDAVLRIAADLERKLPPDYNAIKVKQQIDKQGGATPLNVCLRQETDRLQILLSMMRATLKNLQLAIAGTIIMSQDLTDALNSLYDARVPPLWLKASWPSPTLAYWFNDVLIRCTQFTAWLSDGRPSCFLLSGFYNPQGFLTAMKQESTRKHAGWALDAVTLQTDVLKQRKEDIRQGPSDGVYLYGLFLDGASWNEKHSRLRDSDPKVLTYEVPVVHVTAISSQQSVDTSRFYVCPVYRFPRRTDLNYVFDVTLKTDEPPEKWVLRGVALLCSKV